MFIIINKIMPKSHILDIDQNLVEEYKELREKAKDYRAFILGRYGYKI